jgi:uncharacterized protein (DUF427 family)
MKAIWNGRLLAESDDIVEVEGNAYFPWDSLHHAHFAESSKHTTCGWKGIASYLTVQVDGQRNEDAAWYYPEPKAEALSIKGRVAFWRGVEVRS